MDKQTDIRKMILLFLSAWVKAVQQCTLYGKQHTLTAAAVSGMHELLCRVLAEKPGITLGIIDREIVCDKEPFYEFSRKKGNFIGHLKKMGVSRIQFTAGITREEVMLFILLMTFHIHTEGNLRLLTATLKKMKVRHIRLSSLNADEEDVFNDTVDNLDAYAKKNFEKGINFLHASVTNLKQNKEIDGSALKQIATGLVNSLLMNKQLLMLMSSLRLEDENLFVHNMHVCILTVMQAELLGLEHDLLIEIAGAALMHNLGYCMTDAGFTSAYNPGQYDLDKACAGVKKLLRMDDCTPLTPITAFECNMPLCGQDGSGKVYGRTRNLIGMMVTIACRYDSFRRSGESAGCGNADTLYDRMMQESGTHFHPDLLRNFFSVLGKYPPGTLVELESGEIALVIQSGFQDVCRPRIEILYDTEGRPLSKTRSVNTFEKDRHGKYRWTIAASINPAARSYAHSVHLQAASG